MFILYRQTQRNSQIPKISMLIIKYVNSKQNPYNQIINNSKNITHKQITNDEQVLFIKLIGIIDRFDRKRIATK